ncbi:invasin domain 3-containing protein [Haloferula sp. A504]|uniref:invasin domain 3-containing protein n=1 Tax=Haloferula sp. A504 TaxID=3373601 RepID=UPI0031C0B768|nr:Ig-like domain-containing protein [Verrucomicrobiaceae bacterium E54]
MDNIAISGSVVSGPANPVDAAKSTVAASPPAVLADGTSTSTITVTLKDASDAPVAGEGVTLAKTSGPGTPTISPSSTLTTNGVGVATFTVSSSTVGTNVFTATSVTDSVVVTQNASVDFQDLVVDAGSSTVSASPTAILADNTETSTITVTLRNSGGLPLPGKVVSLTGDASASIDPATDTTDASGVATFTVKSGTVGLETFAATSESVTIGSAGVDFQTVPVAGPVNGGTSTVVASPTTVAGDGTTTSTITVTLKDASGLVVAGEGVTLAKTSGPGSPVITPAGAQTTNASGVATFTVSSGTAGTMVFTATSVTDSVVITQTASVTFTQVGAAFLVSLLNDPVAASTSATQTAPITNFYDGSETVADVGTTNNRGSWFIASGVDSDGVSGTNAHTVVYDMGTIVSFDGFVHAQRKADGVDDITSIDFWVTDSDPGDAATTIPLPIFTSQPTPDDSVNLARSSGVLNEYLLPGGTLTGRWVVMRLHSAGGNPGGYTLQLGRTGAVGDYDNWAFDYPGLGPAGGDDDGDGLTNDEERIFGLNPQNGGSSNPYAVPFDAAAGTFSYTRRTQSLTGLTYKIWYSTNLEEWFWESGATQTPRSPVGAVEIVDVTIDPDLLTEPRLFLQVGAEDLGPPVVLSSLWGSNTTITLNFSEEMDSVSATDPLNYAVNQDGGGSVAITGASLSGDGRTVTLALGSALAIDSAFTVTMDRIANGAGQPLGNGTTGQFRTWDNDPTGIKVFILAGQSNMVGYGHSEIGNGGVAGAIGSLRYLAVNNGTYTEYDYTSLLVDPGQPATSAWKTRSDVKYWGYNGASGNLPTPADSPGKGDLGPPFRGANINWFGPEYAFGQVLGDYYPSDDVLIIKTAWGGHTLVGNFRPPSAVAARGGVVGSSYEEMFNNAREVLLNLDTEFPEWSGRGYQIVGFAWHQGTSDKAPVEVAEEYKFNLPDLIADVRTEFANPDLPFVIASAGMQNDGVVESYPYTGYNAVERAQLWAFPEVPQPDYVLSEDTRPYQESVENSPANQSFHWNQNARSYFRIGLGLGNNMVTLLSTP